MGRSIEFHVSGLAFCSRSHSAVARRAQGESMNVLLIAIGCILMALGLLMAANRARYVYFVVGPGSVLVVAGLIAVLALWILRAAK
jgi:1,4-dihydroxy-2-naphthoate octaprenyltransferase